MFTNMQRMFKLSLAFSVFLFATSVFAESRDELHHFTVQINGKRYIHDAKISEDPPLKAFFMHPLSKVSHIRMQHPDNPEMARIYPIEREVRLLNHEAHLVVNHKSASDFIALDSLGNEYGRIRITFKP